VFSQVIGDIEHVG